MNLTEDERKELSTWGGIGYACPHEGDRCPTPKECMERYGLYAAIESIVATHMADAWEEGWDAGADDDAKFVQSLKMPNVPLHDRSKNPYRQ